MPVTGDKMAALWYHVTSNGGDPVETHDSTAFSPSTTVKLAEADVILGGSMEEQNEKINDIAYEELLAEFAYHNEGTGGPKLDVT